jgi:hypothetical protein
MSYVVVLLSGWQLRLEDEVKVLFGIWPPLLKILWISYFSALGLCSELHETVQQICRSETPNNLKLEKLNHMRKRAFWVSCEVVT